MTKLLYCKLLPAKSKNQAVPTMVLIRGLGRSSSFWLEFSEILTDYFSVCLIDLLGTGQSLDPKGRASIHELAKDVVFTLNTLNLKHFYIIGISLGGMISIECGKILRREQSLLKDFFQGLIILSSSFKGSGHRRISPKGLCDILLSLQNGLPKHQKFAKHLVAPATLQRIPHLPEIWDGIWQREQFKLLPLLRQLYAAATYKLENIQPLFALNVLFVVSKDDRFVSWKNTRALWERFPSSSLVVLEGLGHDITTDAPSLIAKLIFNFLEEKINQSF
ncbi:MAG: alpha/beta hydrolase [Silvanigrellaceae bacterium]|nr:alpha/beta hydrolase [Silvanigrellaceae bacterium]